MATRREQPKRQLSEGTSFINNANPTAKNIKIVSNELPGCSAS